MLRLLCVVVSLLCAADVFARSPGCLEGAFNDALNKGFSVLALNFQKEDTFLVTDLEGISKEIKLNSQKLYDGNAQKCTVIPDRANRVKCVEFRFEVFGKKYMVFAGVYKENGVYPRLYADFQKTRCLDGWEFEENKGKLCDRDVFQFVPKSRSCVNEEVFFIQAKIDIPHCANHIFQELHSKGLVGRVFFATRKHDDVESPHNNGNIQLIGWEQWTKDENQDLNKSKCKYLQKQHHFNAVECHLVKLLVYGKPYLVLYWVYNFLTTSKKVINHSPERMQCQAGMDFNPSRFFSCQEDTENGIFVVATLPTNDYPMIGVGAPRQ